MADIEIRRDHALGREEAKRRVDVMMERLGEKYPISVAWVEDDRLSLKSTGVDGEVSVSDTAVDVTITLGFMAKMMRGTIEGEVERALERGLA